METREVFVFPPPCLSLLPAVVRGAGPSFFILLFSWSASFLLQLRSLFFLHFLLYLVVGFCFFFAAGKQRHLETVVSRFFLYISALHVLPDPLYVRSGKDWFLLIARFRILCDDITVR